MSKIREAAEGLRKYPFLQEGFPMRSAFLDGETAFVVAGPWALVGYSDFLLLVSATTWVENEAELTRLIPVEEEKARKMGRLIRKVL